MATVRIVLKKDKFKESIGKYPAYLLITEGKQNTYISLGHDLREDEFDKKKQKVKAKHKNSVQMNLFFDEWKNRFERFSLENAGKHSLGKLFKKSLSSNNKTDFFVYFKSYIESIQQAGKAYNTIKKLNTTYNLLKEYNKSESLPFSEFDINYLKGFKKFLFNKNQAVNTSSSYLKIIKRVIKSARFENYITSKDDISEKIKITFENSNTIYLMDDQVKALWELKLVQGSVQELHRDIFVFCCYFAGIRFSDLVTLKWKDYNQKEGRINFYINKTKQNKSIKLPSIPLEIIKKHKGKGKRVFLFPLLTDDYLNAKEEVIKKKISSLNALVNKNLKLFAKKVGIENNLSFHVSRHSFATSALSKHIDIYKVKELLGHNDIKSTQVYAKILSKQLDEAMDKFN